MLVRLMSFLVMCILTTPVLAQNIDWNQPEVVSEKLTRENRRVLRFSGTATPGTQIRVRDNKVKMIFSSTNIRWARLPKKHRVQFPVIASETGYFSFDLYLPTTAVEIPLEVFKNGKWVPYKFSFDVPQEGTADTFEFIEDSFKYKKDEENVNVDDFLAEYDKSADQGQVVNDRGEWKSWATGKVFVWGGLGGSYYSITEKLSQGNDLGTFSGFVFPAFELGVEYRWNDQWKIDGMYVNRAGKTTANNGTYQMQNEDFNWTEFRLTGSYFPTSWESTNYRIGIKGGLEVHDLPFVKRVGGPAAYRVYNSSTTFLAAGAALETMYSKAWNYDVSALLIYPVLANDEFKVDSAYGIHLTFSMLKEIIPALSIGGKIDAHWISMSVNHAEVSVPTQTVSVDDNLWHLTPNFILKAEF